MSTDGRPNTGPLDFFYLLKRRGISFDRWCQSVGVRTKAEFLLKKSELEASGEHFIPTEMVVLGNALPDPQEAVEPQEPTKTPTLPPPSLPEPVEPQEEAIPSKKTKKSVST